MLQAGHPLTRDRSASVIGKLSRPREPREHECVDVISMLVCTQSWRFGLGGGHLGMEDI